MHILKYPGVLQHWHCKSGLISYCEGAHFEALCKVWECVIPLSSHVKHGQWKSLLELHFLCKLRTAGA